MTRKQKAKNKTIQALRLIKNIAEKYNIGIWYNGEYGYYEVFEGAHGYKWRVDENPAARTWIADLDDIITSLELGDAE